MQLLRRNESEVGGEGREDTSGCEEVGEGGGEMWEEVLPGTKTISEPRKEGGSGNERTEMGPWARTATGSRGNV